MGLRKRGSGFDTHKSDGEAKSEEFEEEEK